jgi:hypothetical protein
MFRFISIFIYSKSYFYNSIIGPKPIRIRVSMLIVCLVLLVFLFTVRVIFIIQ